MLNLKIKTTAGKLVEISEQTLIETIYEYASQRWKLIEDAEKRLTNVNSTVYYTENGLPRQRKFEAASEEQLITDIFWFQAENYPVVELKKFQYQGKEFNWDKLSTYAHYWLGKGRITFKQFKEKCFNESEKATA